jgi:hypothetical protein
MLFRFAISDAQLGLNGRTPGSNHFNATLAGQAVAKKEAPEVIRPAQL